MKIICTTCCKDKDESPGEIPAVKRYLSSRIAEVYENSKTAGIPFRILSGKYGLLSPEAPIPWYDKKLETEEVEMMIPVLSAQLEKENIREIIFYRLDLPDWEPYIQLIRQACIKTDIILEEILLDDNIAE